MSTAPATADGHDVSQAGTDLWAAHRSQGGVPVAGDGVTAFGDFLTLRDPRHAQAHSPLWDAQLGLWTQKVAIWSQFRAVVARPGVWQHPW